MRGHKVWIGILGIIIGLVFTASCSKSLIPPEIEANGTVGSELQKVAESAELNDGTRRIAPEQDFPIEGSGSDESGLVRQKSLSDASGLGGSSDGSGDSGAGSNFVREENLTESGSVDGAPLISRGDAFAGATDGNTGANGGSGMSANSGINGGSGIGGNSGINGGSSNPFSSGSSKGNQFGSNGNAGSGNGLLADQGNQQARLFSFRSTSELKDIHFQFDKYDLDESSKGILVQNADYLKQHPSVKVEIQGHCDERGTNNYNLALGQRRATSTKRYLASLGIPETRLHVISYGEEKPFCNESSDGCWWRNRRAHFLVAE